MKLSRFAATSALVIVAMGVASGAANAVPVPAHAPSAGTGIHYAAHVFDHSVVVRTDADSMTTRGHIFEILDNRGKVVAGLPLTYQRGNKEWPIAAEIHGHTATLTPSTDPAAAVRVKEAALPLHRVNALSDPNLNQALANLANTAVPGTALGTVTGTAVGAGIGCLVGGIIAGGVGTVATFGALAIPGFLGGCIVTAVAGAALGAMAGTIFVGGPILAAALINFWNDTHAPPAPAAAKP